MCDIDMDIEVDIDTNDDTDFDVSDDSSDLDDYSIEETDESISEDDSFDDDISEDTFESLEFDAYENDYEEIDSNGEPVEDDFDSLSPEEQLNELGLDDEDYEDIAENQELELTDLSLDEKDELGDLQAEDTSGLEYDANSLDHINDIIEQKDDKDALYELRDELLSEEYSEGNDIDKEPLEDENFEDMSDTESERLNDDFDDMNNEELEFAFTHEELEEMIDEESDVENLENVRDALESGELTVEGLEDVTSEEEPEFTFTREDLEEMIDDESDAENLDNIREALESGQIAVEDINDIESDDESSAYTREITPEIVESREKDTETVLENYRENLREYSVDEEAIEDFVESEREKINEEYDSLDNNGEYIYHQPTDWEEVAESLNSQDIDEGQDDADEIENAADEQIIEPISEVDESLINYDEIYEGIEQESLEQGFEDIDIDYDTNRLNSSLEDFSESNWERLSLDDKKSAMGELSNYVVDAIGFENPPAIEYYNNAEEGDYGGYDSSTNTLRVNEYMLYDSNEAADTIAHELWHAHQNECAANPTNPRDYQYQYNFENYIKPEYGQELYENQLVEAEARAFAAQFKDRLKSITGR